MSKKEMVTIIVVIFVVVVATVAYLFITKSKTPLQTVDEGNVPSLYVDTNPMKNQPDINPVSKSNPFRSVKTNPFQ